MTQRRLNTGALRLPNIPSAIQLLITVLLCSLLAACPKGGNNKGGSTGGKPPSILGENPSKDTKVLVTKVGPANWDYQITTKAFSNLNHIEFLLGTAASNVSVTASKGWSCQAKNNSQICKSRAGSSRADFTLVADAINTNINVKVGWLTGTNLQTIGPVAGPG